MCAGTALSAHKPTLRYDMTPVLFVLEIFMVCARHYTMLCINQEIQISIPNREVQGDVFFIQQAKQSFIQPELMYFFRKFEKHVVVVANENKTF